MTKPKEPTLTCSEVVERLRQEAMAIQKMIDRARYEITSPVDDCILDIVERLNDALKSYSWRERRVQELPILEKFEDEIALHGGFGLTIGQLENLRAALVSAIGKATYPRQFGADQEGPKA